MRKRIPQIAGLLAALAGLLNIVSALTRESQPRLEQLSANVPGALTHAATAATAVSGVLLLLVSRALRKRKKRAWRAVVVILAISVVLHVVKGLDVEEALISFAFLAGLVHFRSEFYASADPRTRWRALWVFTKLAVLSVSVGLLLVYIRLDSEVGGETFSEIVQYVFSGFVGVRGPLEFRSQHDAGIIAATLAALGAMTVVVPAYLLLRPAEPRPLMTGEDETGIRELLEAQGARDSLGYFALRNDKSVIWSPTRKAAITYRVLSGVALASGDPIGDPEAWPGAIKEFLALAATHAWTPAVMGCSEVGGIAYTRAGLQALEIGDEAILSVGQFSLEGRSIRGVRQAVNRLERANYETQVRRVRDLTYEERQSIRDIASTWRDGDVERGFSMALGRFGDPQDDDCVLVTATQEGRLRGLLHFVPWGRDGLSLDLMRRDRTAENGINELLIVRALQAAHDLGVSRISLNFAVFRNALESGERLGAGPILRLWRAILIFASRWWQIESLYRFNAKFGPEWEPRYVCYPSAGDLPRIVIASLEAEAFIVWPVLGRATS